MNFGVGDCRNRLNVLKDKYKKEKAKLEGLGGGNSKWPYFKRMDMLMTISPRQEQQCGLACGVDSGEFVFMNPRVYLDHSNVLDEMRDSPGNSCSEGEEEEEEDGGNSARGKGRFKGDGSEESESYRMLSESMKKVGEIYEKIENTKRQHMMELERKIARTTIAQQRALVINGCCVFFGHGHDANPSYFLNCFADSKRAGGCVKVAKDLSWAKTIVIALILLGKIKAEMAWLAPVIICMNAMSIQGVVIPLNSSFAPVIPLPAEALACIMCLELLQASH
ncbi:hypothetical protein Nepgr_025646 [Nepenthes gracilis]|uniref:Uncharacterized protein n=1 Tax=Nepenthes gracilis TaxID=150966 RepID=A0AAD3XZW2_NEPGR|nr:hypothetical protein Nepgr_025646 [Nepenthes gracilis]